MSNPLYRLDEFVWLYSTYKRLFHLVCIYSILVVSDKNRVNAN